MAFSAIPLTGIPFPKSEYDRRQQKVLEAIARAEIDALLVTHHAHIQYLTGYDPAGGAYFAPFPLILIPGRAPSIVVRDYDVAAVHANGCIEDIVPYAQRRDFAKGCAAVLQRHGLKGKKIGLELDAWGLAPADVSMLEAQLPEAKFTDATDVVRLAKAVKSELELQVMREAMALTDLAYQTLYCSLREGITELEMASIIEAELSKAGGQLALPVLAFGERTRLPHLLPARHPIGKNEPVLVEMGGKLKGYAAGVCRSAVLGRHAEAESLHALANESLEAAIAVMKPGVAAGAVDAAARKVVAERSGGAHLFRHRTGYSTGPQWSGQRANVSLEPGEADILEAGMTFHMPIHLFGKKGHIIGCSEHVLVTEGGVEVLSRTARVLHQA